jgi:hypothetical protein
MLVLSLPRSPLIKPITDQDTICHMVHMPIPNSIFDRKAVNNVSNMAAVGPRMRPQTIIIDVTGCMLGRNEKINLPATAKAAKSAMSVSLYVFTYLIPKAENQNLFLRPGLVHNPPHRPWPFPH